ncbi:hypothetical protein HS088_TW06G01167 [Tripterygium wilfordii]|uniref:Uncharacterized protein n=1 Tax=Tripterygium wilfordii TaxID=458696 RepID=A0A7J7DKU8_TRIWF|nr:hypothetical protein HS088_TW06G01167 [Tripterygium wilfordii]
MARVKLVIPTTFFFLLLLFSWGSITFTEARLLKMSRNYVENSLIMNMEDNEDGVNSRRIALQDDGVAAGNNIGPDAASTDDFRPTTPGHSPGAGH